MTRIGLLLEDASRRGVSYSMMSRRAHSRGAPISSQRLQQIAKGNNGKRLTADMVRGVAAALELGVMAIATLDDEDRLLGPPAQDWSPRSYLAG